MKRLFFLMILAICFTFDINGQNLVFLGDRSFPSSETYTLKSNSQGQGFDDLRIVFARDGKGKRLVINSRLSSSFEIGSNLIVYLNDGEVITPLDVSMNDHVDGVFIAAYGLSDGDIAKMKNSNIHTIRYEIKYDRTGFGLEHSSTRSASNTGKHKTDFTEVISNFFND